MFKKLKEFIVKRRVRKTVINKVFAKEISMMHFFTDKHMEKRLTPRKLMTLIYLADVLFIKKYGKPISSGGYFPFKNAKKVKYIEKGAHIKYAKGKIDIMNNLIYSVNPFKNNEGLFVQIEIDTMNYIWETFGHLDDVYLEQVIDCYPLSMLDVFNPIGDKHMEVLKKFGFTEDPLKVSRDTLKLASKAFKDWLCEDD